MSLRVVPAAVRDLADIENWVLEHFGPEFVASTRASLFETFRLLERFPQLGSARPDVTTRPVRFYSLRHYWITYTPGDPLQIHRVYHAARDLARLRLNP